MMLLDKDGMIRMELCVDGWSQIRAELDVNGPELARRYSHVELAAR